MLSRVAENVYWLSRYLERIQNYARLINVHGQVLLDLPDVKEHDGWMRLISISGLDSLYSESFDQANEINVCRFLIVDESNPASMLNAAHAIRVNLRSSRDILPKQLYERISRLVRFIRTDSSRGANTANRREFLDAVERQALEIAGAVRNSMRHDQAYRFMRMASYLERADITTRVLDVPSSILTTPNKTSRFVPYENRDWAAALQSLSAMQMYRRHVRQPVSPEGCLNFLLNDKELPTACNFCLVYLDRCLSHLNRSDKARAAVKQLIAQLAAADIAMLAENSQARHQFLDQFQLGLIGIGNSIAETYFPPLMESA